MRDPFGTEDAHDYGAPSLAANRDRLSADSFSDKSNLLVCSDCRCIKVIDVQLEPKDGFVDKRLIHGEPHEGVDQPSSAHSRSQNDPRECRCIAAPVIGDLKVPDCLFWRHSRRGHPCPTSRSVARRLGHDRFKLISVKRKPEAGARPLDERRHVWYPFNQGRKIFACEGADRQIHRRRLPTQPSHIRPISREPGFPVDSASIEAPAATQPAERSISCD